MIKLNVTAANIAVEEKETLTEGRVGLLCRFSFTGEWDGLAKTAVFDGADSRDVILTEDTVAVPAECLAAEGYSLSVGVYGKNAAGDIVIPTVYATVGKIQRSAYPAGKEAAPTTPDIVAQIQQAAANAEAMARAVREDAELGKFKGEPGEPGGWYTPEIKQPIKGAMVVNFTPSKEGMPAAPGKNIILPQGETGETGGYYTPAVTQPDENTLRVAFTPSKEGMPAVADTEITLPAGQKGDKGDAGAAGANGKSAYAYAVEGGYTGTEAEFAAKLAAEIPAVDGTLTQPGQAADAKATGDAISALSEEIATITLGKHTDGLIYVFLNGTPIGNGLNLSDTSGGQDEESLPVFANVTWDNTAYAIGNNHEYAYNAWSPNCAHYDSVTKKVMFLQCHRTSHTGTFGASELIAIDPYNVMEYEVIKTFDPINSAVPLCFAIYNGIYYIMSKNTVYTSKDHGYTWTETAISTPLGTAYGLNIIDGVWYIGNDGFTDETDGLYAVSYDNGKNWETKAFDLAAYSGELTCSEASFVKWNGNIFASLRRENANGLLIRQNEDGTWKVLTDALPNVSSDCALSVTEDRLCYAAINRPSVQIEIGTITISAEDTVSVEPFFTKSFAEVSGSGDFHTPTYVYGPDFQMVTFMTNAVSAKEYIGAVNACIVGYADGVEAVGYDYDVITGHLGSNWSTEPYVGAAPDLSSGVATTVDGAVINYNGTVPTYYPSINGDIVTFNAAAGSACKNGVLNNLGQAFGVPIMHALQNENGEWIACLSKKKDSTGAASLRFVAKTYKHTILSQPEIQGGTEFNCAVYKAAAGSINTAYLSYPIPANLTKRLSVSG